jgi:hypothetical protein
MAKRRSLSERLASKLVENDHGCLVFMGCRNSEGYGRITEGGHAGRIVYAHRVAWELVHGPIPEGLLVLHTCDNPPCCNPAHLRVGTHLENIQEMYDRKRDNGVTARNRGKTHCPNGHPYDMVINRKRGPERKCRVCKNEAAREYRRRKRDTTTEGKRLKADSTSQPRKRRRGMSAE